MRITILLLCCFLFSATSASCAEIVAQWQFNDASNFGKERFGLHATVKGKPHLVPGKFGQAISLAGSQGKTQMPHEYLIVPHHDKLNFGWRSFSVECWVKTDEIDYSQFIGKRQTARRNYSKKGWSLGMGKGGELMFTVDDEKIELGTNTAKAHFLSTNWDTYSWNYVVGIRDVEKRELRLYVNGTLVSTITDRTGSIDTPVATVMGYDAYAGKYMKGLLDGCRISNGVLSEQQIKDAFWFELNLLPVPQEMVYSKDVVQLKQPITVVLPDQPSSVEKRALTLIQQDIKYYFGLTAIAAAEKAAPPGTTIRFARSKTKMRPEGYRLEKNKGEDIITIKSSDHGVLYGALTLIDILKKTTLYRGNTLSCPSEIAIKDYPVIANRYAPSGIYTPLTELHAIIPSFERCMRSRLNGVHIHATRIEGASDQEVKRVVDEATSRGLKVWAAMSYRRRKNFSTLDEEDRRYIVTFFERMAKAGAKGFAFYFDDTMDRQVVLGENEVKQYRKHIGLFQQSFVKIMVDVGKKWGVSDYVVCPTPYMRSWEKSSYAWWGRGDKALHYKNYFQELTGGEGLESVRTFHCEFHPAGLEKLKAAGLRNYAYWVNGLWGTPRWVTWELGTNRLALTWYGFVLDEKSGYVPIPESREHWRNIAQETDTVFFGTSGNGLKIGGIWTWNPKVFDDEKSMIEICTQDFGWNTYPLLREYGKNLGPLIGLFKAYKTPFFAECNPPIIKRQAPTRNELKIYWKGLKQNKKILEHLEQRVRKTQSPLKAPRDKTKSLRKIQVMKKDLQQAEDKLIFLIKRL